jgi:large subunit ribosomal protein L7/L12
MAEEKKEEIKEEKPSPDQEKKEESLKEEKKEEAPKEEKKEEPSKEEPEEEIEVPEKFKSLVEGIEKLSVLDLAELVKILEKKFGVSAAVPMAAAPAQGAGGGNGEEAEEKSEFNIELQDAGDKKIEVIKVVRDITGKGLKDSKDLVDSVASEAQMIKEGVKKEEADEIKKKFEEAGAKVELK